MFAFLAGMAVFISCGITKQPKTTADMSHTKQEINSLDTAKSPAFIESLLQQYPQYFGEILKKPGCLECADHLYTNKQAGKRQTRFHQSLF